MRHHETANRGSQYRGDADDQHEHGKHLGTFGGSEEIAHHGAGGDHAATATQRLHKPVRDEVVGRISQRAADGCHNVDYQTDDKRYLTAVAVEQWTVNDLAGSDTDEEGGKR